MKDWTSLSHQSIKCSLAPSEGSKNCVESKSKFLLTAQTQSNDPNPFLSLSPSDWGFALLFLSLPFSSYIAVLLRMCLRLSPFSLISLVPYHSLWLTLCLGIPTWSGFSRQLLIWYQLIVLVQSRIAIYLICFSNF